jgi:GTPase SAR1 family protein
MDHLFLIGLTRKILRFADDPVPVPWPGPRQQQAKNNFKVVFLGKSGVGKTSITLRFCRDTFQDGTEATIGFVRSHYEA